MTRDPTTGRFVPSEQQLTVTGFGDWRDGTFNVHGHHVAGDLGGFPPLTPGSFGAHRDLTERERVLDAAVRRAAETAAIFYGYEPNFGRWLILEWSKPNHIGSFRVDDIRAEFARLWYARLSSVPMEKTP